MRNPKRIPEFLKEVEKSWSKYPDWRLGQLIGNLSYFTDSYYMEDEILEKRLKKELKNDK